MTGSSACNDSNGNIWENSFMFEKVTLETAAEALAFSKEDSKKEQEEEDRKPAAATQQQEQEESKQPRRKRRKRVIQFDPSVRVRRVDLIKTDSERMARWYLQDEMKRVEEDARMELAEMRRAKTSRSSSSSSSSSSSPQEAAATTTTTEQEGGECRVGPFRRRHRHRAGGGGGGVMRRRCRWRANATVVPVNETSTSTSSSSSSSSSSEEKEEDVSWTMRGLEHLIMLEVSEYRQSLRRSVTRSVLMAQERERLLHRIYSQDQDQTNIAMASSQKSQKAQDMAIAMAKADEAYVQRLYQLGKPSLIRCNAIRGLSNPPAQQPPQAQQRNAQSKRVGGVWGRVGGRR